MLRKILFGRFISTFSFQNKAAMNYRTSLLTLAILFVAGWNSTAHAVLEGYWKFDESTGSNAFNSSGSVNPHLGTLVAFPNDDSQWQSGRFGNALAFNSQSSVVQLLATNPVSLSGGNWTISAWFQGVFAGTGYHTLARSSTADHPILLESGINLRLGTYDNGGGGFFPATAPGLNGNTISGGIFHNIVAVGSGTTTKFYYDGAYVGSAAFKSTTDVGGLGNNYGAGQAFADKIDDMGVFDQALNDGEAKSIFSLAMEPGLDYDLGEANQLIQAFENSAPSVVIGDLTWVLVNDGSLTGAEGEVAAGNLMLYSINFANGNGFAVFIAPEPSSLTLFGFGAICLAARSRRRRNAANGKESVNR